MRKDDIHFLLQNPHVQTLWGARFRRLQSPKIQAEKLELKDGDFLNIFWGEEQDGPVICIFHGLEGSVESKHILGLMSALNQRGFQTVAMNHRSCGGEINRLSKAYHSGMTEDIIRVFELVAERFPQRRRSAVAYSLGGSMLLNYLIDASTDCLVDSAVIVSAPIDLVGCANHIGVGLSRLYMKFFLSTLRKKTKIKRELLEKAGINVDLALASKDFWDFDELITAPVHGFAGAEDYYARCSTKDRLKEISTPHFFLTSRDDPVIGPLCIPEDGEVSSSCTLCVTEYGGHVGFVEGHPSAPRYWGEEQIVNWLWDYFSDDSDQLE